MLTRYKKYTPTFRGGMRKWLQLVLGWLKSFSPKTPNKTFGFTLAELIASTSIIIITTGGFTLFVMKSAETQRTSNERAAAEKIMQGEMEKLYSQPFEELNVSEESILYPDFRADEDYGRLVQCWKNEAGVITQAPPLSQIASNPAPEVRKISLTRTDDKVVTKDVKIFRSVEWEKSVTIGGSEPGYERATCANSGQKGLKRLTVRVEWETKKGKKEVASLVAYRSAHTSPNNGLPNSN